MPARFLCLGSGLLWCSFLRGSSLLGGGGLLSLGDTARLGLGKNGLRLLRLLGSLNNG